MKPTTSFYSVIQQYQVHEVGVFLCVSSQLAITCSKLTIETLEQGVKCVQT